MELFIKTGIVKNRFEFFEKIEKEKIAHRFWNIVKKAHYEKITPFEFANILYRFAKDRYYIDMRKKQKKMSDDNKVIKSAINSLERYKDDKNSTYFEAFFKRREELQKIVNKKDKSFVVPFRNRQHTFAKLLNFITKEEVEDFSNLEKGYYFMLSNSQMADSIKEIAKRQREFGNKHPIFDEETVDKWYKIVTFKGKIPNIEDKIGLCISGNGKKRCAKNSIDAELFRIADTYNNLYFSGDKDCHIRDLGITQEDFKNIILDINKEKITIEQFIKYLKKKGYLDKDLIVFLKRDRRILNKSDATLIWIPMHNMVSKLNDTLAEKIMEDIPFREKLEEILLMEIDLDIAEERIKKLFNEFFISSYTDEDIEKIVNFNTGKPTVCSSEAFRKIMPLIIRGNSFKEAIEKVYNISIEGKQYKRKYLSYKIYKKEQKEQNINNPFLDNVVYNFIWIFNKLVQKFGSPDKIVFETTRAILSEKKKEEIEREQNRKRKENEQIYKIIADKFKNDKAIISRNIDEYRKRLKAFLQQGGKLDGSKTAKCIYTDKPISLEQALDEQIIELDHIIPKSTGYVDNSLNNLILTFNLDNRAKSNRTPIQYMIEVEKKNKKDALEILKKRIKTMSFPKRKRDNILTVLMTEEIKFKKENDMLMDNQKEGVQNYAVKLIMDLIARQYDFKDENLSISERKAKIIPVKGTITSNLREVWLKGYKKNRDEYVNHAVDAMIMLNLDKATVQDFHTKFNELSRQYSNSKKILEYIAKNKKPKIEDFEKKAMDIIGKFRNEELFVYHQEIRRNPYKKILEETVDSNSKDKGTVKIIKKGINGKEYIYYKKAFRGFEKIEVYETYDPKMKKNFICKIVKTAKTISNIEKDEELKRYKKVKLKEVFYRNTPIEIVDKKEITRGVVIGGKENRNTIELKLINKKNEKRILKSIKTVQNIKRLNITPYGLLKFKQNCKK